MAEKAAALGVARSDGWEGLQRWGSEPITGKGAQLGQRAPMAEGCSAGGSAQRWLGKAAALGAGVVLLITGREGAGVGRRDRMVEKGLQR
ncbi:hypothetical protein CYMTET_49906 [Cymbomonas tetramitiformis]|uniref:Uncharacterized protein n=1 Tax=Cymbomonas tetramitiformis TaxID=36881 RepID=A0AAE0BQX7_9CHLO|nr:hypothetical protein CYMTET_49906 [Cymbomonas tetramitiformis]